MSNLSLVNIKLLWTKHKSLTTGMMHQLKTSITWSYQIPTIISMALDGCNQSISMDMFTQEKPVDTLHQEAISHLAQAMKLLGTWESNTPLLLALMLQWLLSKWRTQTKVCALTPSDNGTQKTLTPRWVRTTEVQLMPPVLLPASAAFLLKSASRQCFKRRLMRSRSIQFRPTIYSKEWRRAMSAQLRPSDILRGSLMFLATICCSRQ